MPNLAYPGTGPPRCPGRAQGPAPPERPTGAGGLLNEFLDSALDNADWAADDGMRNRERDDDAC
jgi:hypothetical protein